MIGQESPHNTRFPAGSGSGTETLHPWRTTANTNTAPQKPALIEAGCPEPGLQTNAKMETFMEALQNAKDASWLGYNRLFESNIRNDTDGVKHDGNKKE